MASIMEQVANNTARYDTDYNMRGSSIVRTFCEEHSASTSNGTAEFAFGYDTDLSLCVEWKFKIFFTGSSSIHYDPIVNGNGTYKTMEQWLAAYPVGTGVNTDGAWGCQCWDYADAFWRAQVNRGFSTGGTGMASGAWTHARSANAGTEFDTGTDWTQIKKGYWCVWGGNPGHVAMAAEDYNGTNSMLFYGQNQGGTPTVGGGSTINIATLNKGTFLGWFHYKGWA